MAHVLRELQNRAYTLTTLTRCICTVATLTEGTLAQGNEVGDVFVTWQLQQHGVFRFTQTLQLREKTVVQLVSVKLVMNLNR